MALDLSSLSNATNKIQALGNLILVSPQKTIGMQPQNSPSYKKDTSAQPSALLFNIMAEQSAQFQSDISDHFIENNTVVQDQIALKPITVTIKGFVGELNDIAPAALAPLQTAAEKLTAVSAYAPSLSTTALLAYTNAFQLYQVAASALNSAISTWSTINGSGGQSVINGGGISKFPNQTQQQIYFQQFYAYWSNRNLFTIQTPWAIFQDMAIMNFNAIQSAETKMITDFEIQFKQMRFAATQSTVEVNANNMSGRAYEQASGEVDLGTNPLEPSSKSFSNLIG